MNLMITGRGSSGSWQIRGVQLGSAVGGQLIPKATRTEAYSHTIVVKRHQWPVGFKPAGVILWDVVDAWPQPAGNKWSRERLIQYTLQQAEAIKADYVIAATECMRQDLGADFTLYHHHRPDLALNPIRPKVQAIGYEGSPKYLGQHLYKLQGWCKSMGIAFVLNPPQLADIDIVLAIRDGAWTGYGPLHWKSNVKLANAQGSGTPIICNRERGYLETSSGGEVWADTWNEIEAGLIDLLDYETRKCNAEQLLLGAYTLEQAADHLRGILDKV